MHLWVLVGTAVLNDDEPEVSIGRVTGRGQHNAAGGVTQHHYRFNVVSATSRARRRGRQR